MREFVFNVPPAAKVIRRWCHCLKSEERGIKLRTEEALRIHSTDRKASAGELTATCLKLRLRSCNSPVYDEKDRRSVVLLLFSLC